MSALHIAYYDKISAEKHALWKVTREVDNVTSAAVGRHDPEAPITNFCYEVSIGDVKSTACRLSWIVCWYSSRDWRVQAFLFCPTEDVVPAAPWPVAELFSHLNRAQAALTPSTNMVGLEPLNRLKSFCRGSTDGTCRLLVGDMNRACGRGGYRNMSIKRQDRTKRRRSTPSTNFIG